MQPDALRPAQGCDRCDRIDGAAHGGAGRGHHRQHRLSAVPGCRQTIGQASGIEATLTIHRHRPQRRGRQPHHRQRLGDRHMGIGAAEHQRVAAPLQASAVARHHQGHQVAERAAAGGYAARSHAETKPLGQPGRQAALQPRQAWCQFLSQQVVVEASHDQIANH